MKRAALLLLLPLAWLAACQDGRSPLAPEGAGLSQASVAQAPVKQIKGWSQGGEVWSIPCDGGRILLITGDGVATHLGKIHLSLHVCLNSSAMLADTASGGTVTVANGDELEVRIRTMALREGATDATYAIVGGTGRFLDAKGALASKGLPAELPSWANEFSGWIQY